MPLESILAFQLFNGIVWGLIFALIALGLSLTFGLMNLMNIAHAAFYMLGAVITATLIQWGLGFWEAVLIATLTVGLIGVVVNQLILVHVADAPPVIGLLATAGLLLLIDSLTLASFGSVPVAVDAPFDAAIPLLGLEYPTYRLLVAGIAALLIVATFLFLRWTPLGLWMRAVPGHRELAVIAGIAPNRINLATVVLGSLLAGMAGGLVTPIAGAHFQMGDAVLAPAFTVIVVGGAGNLWGAVTVAIGLGILRGVVSAFTTPTQAEILSLMILLPLLLLRPNGLFGNKHG